MANTPSINLLRSHENHFWENAIKWALTTGRFLIILTQTIALAAFVYRFSLDREIIDLTDEIKQNQALVSLYGDQEVRYRNLHERLAFAETLTTPQSEKAVLLERFVSVARGKVTFQRIALSDSTVTIEAATSSTGALAAFLASVRSMSNVASMNVDRVENKPTSGLILVTVTATLTGATEKGGNDATE